MSSSRTDFASIDEYAAHFRRELETVASVKLGELRDLIEDDGNEWLEDYMVKLRNMTSSSAQAYVRSSAVTVSS